MFGRVATPNDYTIMVKYDSSFALQWELMLDKKGSPLGYHVGDAETYTYGYLDSEGGPGILVQILSASGAIDKAGMANFEYEDRALIDSDLFSTRVFYTSKDSSGNAYICQWCPNDISQDCYVRSP